MNKWIACYIVLNGEDFIYESLQSIIKFIKESNGKIIIIEGATPYALKYSIKGLSIDKTNEKINKFIKDYNAEDYIIYDKIGFVDNKKDLRNRYLEIAHKLNDNIDWVLIVDDDELYKYEELKQLDKFVTANDYLCHVSIENLWFWKDKNHIACFDEDYLLKQIKIGKTKLRYAEDYLGNKMVQSVYPERIFKYSKGLHYNNHPTVSDENQRDLYIHDFYKDKRILYSKCKLYHYGYLESIEELFIRFRYYAIRDSKLNNQNEIKNKIINDKYILYLLGKHKKFKKNNPEIIIKKFNGEHPFPIKNKKLKVNIKKLKKLIKEV